MPLRLIAGTCAVVALAYVALCVLLYMSQRSMIYFPQAVPAGRDDRPSTTLAVEGAQLRIVERPREGAAAVLYFGGNAEDARLTRPALAAVFPDRALYLPQYRGYGGSSGAPAEAALLADAVAVYDRVHAAHPQVTVVGRSLGSGVAAYLASVRPVERLVLVTPFLSVEDIARREYPFVPVRWLLRERFDSGLHATQVRAPTLLVAAEHDELIPLDSSEALLARFPPGVARLIVVPGTDHGDISEAAEYAPLLRGER